MSLDDDRARALGIARTPSVVGRAGAFIPGRLDRIGSGRADRVLDVRSASGLGARGGDDDDVGDVGERTNDLRVRRDAARGRSVAGSNVPVSQPSPTRGCSLVFAHHARVVSPGVSMSDDDDDG